MAKNPNIITNSDDSVEFKIRDHNKIRLTKEKQYFVWKDTNLLWTILIMFLVFFIVISFLDIKWVTTLHSYTINVFFGVFSILIYIWCILFCLRKLLNLKKTYSKSIFHFSLWRLFVFILGIVIFASTIYYVSYHIKGYEAKDTFKNVFNEWFKLFKSSNNEFLPYKFSPGIIGTFFYALFSSFGKTGGIVSSFIFSIIILVFSCLVFFISDYHFMYLSFNKKRREFAKNQIFKLKTNQGVRYVSTDIFKSSENNEELKKKIIDNDSKTLKTNDESNVEKNIKDKLDKTENFSINLERENIKENLPKNLDPKLTNESKTNNDFDDDDPFYTTTFEEIEINKNNKD